MGNTDDLGNHLGDFRRGVELALALAGFGGKVPIRYS